MNHDWEITCTHCHRRSQQVKKNTHCPWCNQCSPKWERWLDGHVNFAWMAAILILMFGFFFAVVIGISPVHADEPTVTKRNDKIVIDYPNGDYLERKKTGNMWRTSGVRNGKMVFDYKTPTQQKVEDIENGIRYQTKKYDDPDD